MPSPVTLLDEPERVHLALSGPRRRILAELAAPGSATQLAELLGLSRQQVNYHVRMLERAGLVELVEEIPRRGCVERIVRAAAGAFVVDPAVLQAAGGRAEAAPGDRFAAEHLVATAGAVVRDVCRMQDAAERAGRRLLTFTVETDIRFGGPTEVHAFTTELADAVASLAQRYQQRGGRPYRVVVGGHPTPHTGSTGGAEP